MQVTEKITITNEDNMALMARYPDNYFDLAIVDPPYGIGFGAFNRTNKATNGQRVKANKYKPNLFWWKLLFTVGRNRNSKSKKERGIFRIHRKII